MSVVESFPISADADVATVNGAILLALTDGTSALEVRTGAGDTLAEFIVREIADTFETDAPEASQFDSALCAMRRACTELTGVIEALEERKDAHAAGG